MAFIKKIGFFGAPLAIMAAGALSTQGCSEDVCGPCGDVEKGALGISGSAKLDGFFNAVAIMKTQSDASIKEFELGLANLEAAFGLEATGDLSDRVGALNAAIETQIQANVDGSLTVDYVEAKCTANVDVAVNAQANCEVEAGCEVEAECTGGEVSVECEGTCQGSCTGGCEGEASCTVSGEAAAECMGSCEGSCDLEVAATCEGTCRGTCSGNCSATDASGQCAGSCDADCQGTCELKAGGSCSGTCHGKCTASVEVEADCTGEIKCDVSCNGECSGGCDGTATPPSCTGSAECEASADCQASASAQASADIECTPPSISVNFALSANANADAAATFSAQMASLQVNGVAMLGSFAKYGALFEGESCAAVSVAAGLETVLDGVLDGSLVAEVPAGKLPCVEPAVRSSISTMTELTADAGANLAAQSEFALAFTSGFSG